MSIFLRELMRNQNRLKFIKNCTPDICNWDVKASLSKWKPLSRVLCRVQRFQKKLEPKPEPFYHYECQRQIR